MPHLSNYGAVDSGKIGNKKRMKRSTRIIVDELRLVFEHEFIVVVV
jgi:hypothetical protein